MSEKIKSLIKTRKINIGLVGCGRISEKHLNAIRSYPDDLRLVAVCDIDSEVLNKVVLKSEVTKYTDYSAFIKHIGLDIIVIATPSGLHASQTIEAASYGKHVVTEKPMATSWKDGIRMVKACDDANVKLFVVKQNRYNNTIQLLKRAINEKRFGRIYMVNINVFWTRPQEYYDSADWRGTWSLDGGAFMNQASHYVDLLDWLIGPVDKVHAITGTLGRNIQVEDTGVLNVRWKNGALGSMNVTMLTYPKNLEGSITILGEKGTVRVGGVAVNDIQHWKFDEPKDYDDEVKEANYQTTSVYGFGHPLYYNNVIEVLRGNAEPETDGREGLKSLEILIAAYLSARDGKTISLPLEY